MLNSHFRLTECIDTPEKHHMAIGGTGVNDDACVLEVSDKKISDLVKKGAALSRITYYDVCGDTFNEGEKK